MYRGRERSLPKSAEISAFGGIIMATFFNQATLSYNGNVRSSNITSGEIINVLSATKSAVTDTYSTNDDIVYIISIVNTGTSAFNGITITDDLGEYTVAGTAVTAVPLTYVEDSVKYYVNGIAQPAPTIADTQPLTITGINIPAGSNATIIYAAETNSFAPLAEGSEITNTVEVSGTGFTAFTASETITPISAADLTISKSLSPAAVEENGEITYTFLIQNFGSKAAEVSDNVIFADTFTPVLTGLTATYNDAAWTEGTNYTYDETTGEFESAAGQITVPAATFTQDAVTGAWSVQPGVSTIRITGNITL